MRHSRAFREEQDRLHQREEAIKKEIESDSIQAIKTGKRIFAVLTVGFFALKVVRLVMHRGTKSAVVKTSRVKSRWLPRVLEFVIPFLISAILEQRKQDQKSVNNS